MNTPSLSLMLAACLAIAGCGNDGDPSSTKGTGSSGTGAQGTGGEGTGATGATGGTGGTGGMGATGGTGGNTGGTGGTGGNTGGTGGVGGTGGSGATGGGGAGGSGGGVVAGTLGFMVIDVQELFVNWSVTPDMPGIINNMKTDFQLAESDNVPFFMSYEASKTGSHALHAPLVPLVPPQAQEFVKTKFDASQLPALHDALANSGLSHLVVMGAETDVCVLQTVLGLRTMGFTVIVEQDAIFTSESNTGPAIRRMKQAGALFRNQAEVAGYVANQNALPAGGNEVVRITDPLHMGVVLNNFTDASIAGNNDVLKSQKNARLHELLLVCEWFELPVYSTDPAAGIPAAFDNLYQGQLKPISQIPLDVNVTQLVFAGTDGGVDNVMSPLMATHQLFVMEDALLAQGSAAAQKAMLLPLFDNGLVPTTYKGFYYDMTKSVSTAQWPNPVWVMKFNPFYFLTQAPEDLPPIPDQG